MKVSTLLIAGGILLMLGACRATVHRGIGFGGGFSVPDTRTSTAVHADAAVDQGGQDVVSDLQATSELPHAEASGKLNVRKASSPAGMNARPKPLKIDSLPPYARYNAADSMLEKAQTILIQYNKGLNKQRKGNVVIASILVILGLFTALVFSAGIDDQGEDNLFIALILLMFTAAIILFSIAVGIVFLIALLAGAAIFTISKSKLKHMRAQAVDHIRNAPRYAPENRMVEYEIRSLRMLRNDLTWPQAQSKILQIRRMIKDDPSHPWYPLLRQTAQELQIPWTVM